MELDLNALVLWGVPLLGLVGGILSLLKWALPSSLPEKVVKLVGFALIAGGVMAISAVPEFEAAYPVVALWVQRGLWALAAGLIYTGDFPGLPTVKRALKL